MLLNYLSSFFIISIHFLPCLQQRKHHTERLFLILCLLTLWFRRDFSASLFSPLLIRPSAVLRDVCCLRIFTSLMHLSTVCPNVTVCQITLFSLERIGPNIIGQLAGSCAAPTVYLRADRQTDRRGKQRKTVFSFYHSAFFTVSKMCPFPCERIRFGTCAPAPPALNRGIDSRFLYCKCSKKKQKNKQALLVPVNSSLKKKI